MGGGDALSWPCPLSSAASIVCISYVYPVKAGYIQYNNSACMHM